MSKPLTAASVAKLTHTETRREIPDGGCPGLYLTIYPTGAKSWALRFRRPDGRPARLVLGTAHVQRAGEREPDTEPTIGGHLTLAAAHALVGQLRHEIKQGRDPAAAHIRAKRDNRTAAVNAAANTFETAARDFINQHARKKVRRWPELARLLGLNPDNDALNLIPKGLAERWAARPVAEIDGHDIHAIVDEARKIGVPGLARRNDDASESRARKMFGVLSKLFGWLARDRRVTGNPCASVARPEIPRARDRVLDNAEIAKFWKATDAVGEPFGRVLKLLLLTGGRLNEVARMETSEIKDDGARWELPASRTKNRRAHVVPLPKLARDIIKDRKIIEGSKFAFSIIGSAPIGVGSKVKDKLDGMLKLKEPWVLHDLRRTAATGMAELGIAPHIVEATLNHISGARAGVAGTYNRAMYMDEKQAALERWAAHIQRVAEGKSDKVVALRPAS